jgi:SHS2 domain-containing protein
VNGADSGEDPRGSFAVLDHPADVRLRLRGPDPAALYDAAVRGLAAVITDQAPPGPVTSGVDVDLEGVDEADLLVRLLNEALYRLESGGDLAVGFTASQAVPRRLTGTLRLARPGPSQAGSLLEVKAATYGDLRWEHAPDGAFCAEITLDL